MYINKTSTRPRVKAIQLNLKCPEERKYVVPSTTNRGLDGLSLNNFVSDLIALINKSFFHSLFFFDAKDSILKSGFL